MLLVILLAVFVAGLMIGRTPEFLGKKIEAREIKLVVARRCSSCRCSSSLQPRSRSRRDAGLASIFNPGAHGFTETLYA